MSMSVSAGTRLGPYEIVSLIGKGGMGEVYHARDTRLGRKVALKVLSEDVTQNEDRVRRFQQEARAASALNHPNIITIYDVGQIDSAHFIATELIEGETLRQRMKRTDMGLLEILDVAIQSATALAAAHAAGIMHRDIKPENIMLRADGYVKVLDFGLAKLVENTTQGGDSDPEAETQSFVNTKPGTVMGTVSYMSPEQARGLVLDSRTDIFSLGVVIYEMIAGRPPFDGATVSEIIASIISKRPAPMARYVAEVPMEMERIVSKALVKDRDERYQTTKDLLIDLRRLKQQLEFEAERDSGHAELSLPRITSNSGGQSAIPVRDSSSRTQEMLAQIGSQSSAEYIIKEIKRHKMAVLVAFAVITLVVAGYLFYPRSKTIDSIVVIPFATENGDANTQILSHAVAQRIITGLLQMPNLQVKPFITGLQYEGKASDPQAIGKQLNVAAVMTGKIIKREGDDSIFVSVELINAHDNTLIWAEQYDRKFADVRKIQEEILKGVLEKIGPPLTEEQKRRRDAELRTQEGRTYWERRSAKDIRNAIRYFEQANSLAPDYAPAYAGLADCYSMLVAYGAEPPREALPKAKEAAEKALRLDDRLAEAHASLAFVRFRLDWNWDEAEKEFLRARELNSQYGETYIWYANLLTALGRFKEAEDMTLAAQRIDPFSRIVQSHFGFIYYFAHRYDDVIANGQKTLKLDPNFFAARRYLSLAYAQKGMYKEAIAESQKAIAASGSMILKAELGSAYALSGNRTEAQKVIDELKEISNDRYISPYYIAMIYAGMGDKDQAFEWLEKGYEDRADYMVYLKVDPRFESLRSDPRFENLLQRIGLD
jgi:serine/threonine-protein kinase